MDVEAMEEQARAIKEGQDVGMAADEPITMSETEDEPEPELGSDSE
jgi:hypothetical protein